MPNNKIGARKKGNFKAVSTAPSFNKTPVGASTPPLPYPTTQDLGNSVGVVPTVKFNGDPAYVLNQTTQPSCKGDNAGVAKGVKSNTVNGEVKPVKGSSTVRVGGKPIIRQGDPCTMNGGNNPGIYITTQAPSGAPAKSAAQTSSPPIQAETPTEKSFLEQAAKNYKDKLSPALHDFAGDAMDKGGTIAVAGGGTAAVGGAMVATGIGAAPGAMAVVGGGATAAVGGGVSAVGAIVEGAATGLDAAANYVTGGQLNAMALATASAKKMAMRKIDKLINMLPGKKSTAKPEAAKPAKPGPAGDGVKVKGKKKLKCGEGGKYGELKKKTGDGKFDRDHIPSKAALKEKALELNGGVPLTAAQKKAIDNWGNSIAIPRQAHIDVSPTHGTKNIKLAPKDATDLAGAARRDVNAMLKKIDEYDADGGCKKAYQKSAKKVLEMSNKDFEDALQNIIDKV